jgi:ricin-type beta-trefoil lectin protein
MTPHQRTAPKPSRPPHGASKTPPEPPRPPGPPPSGPAEPTEPPGQSESPNNGRHRSEIAKWLVPALLGLLGITITAIATIIVAEINHKPDPPAPSPTPSPTLTSTNPSPSPTHSTSPTPRPTTPSPTPPVTPAPTPPAIPKTNPAVFFYIQNSGTGVCLSYYLVSPSAGPGQCGSGATTDGWQHVLQPNGTFELLNKEDGQCLQEQNANGGIPAVAVCSGTPAQQWGYGYANYYGTSLVNRANALCLTADASTNPITINLKPCTKQPNQLWKNTNTL